MNDLELVQIMVPLVFVGSCLFLALVVALKVYEFVEWLRQRSDVKEAAAIGPETWPDDLEADNRRHQAAEEKR